MNAEQIRDKWSDAERYQTAILREIAAQLAEQTETNKKLVAHRSTESGIIIERMKKEIELLNARIRETESNTSLLDTLPEVMRNMVQASRANTAALEAGNELLRKRLGVETAARSADKESK